MDRERILLRHGFFLFLVSLLTGLIAYQLTNPRMGVAAHVEGIINGIFLMVLGLAWQRLELPPHAGFWAYWTGVVGAYSNWAIPLFSAVVGASRPRLAGSGFSAAPWAESLMPLTGVGGVIAPIVCAGIVLWALRGRSAAQPGAAADRPKREPNLKLG